MDGPAIDNQKKTDEHGSPVHKMTKMLSYFETLKLFTDERSRSSSNELMQKTSSLEAYIYSLKSLKNDNPLQKCFFALCEKS